MFKTLLCRLTGLSRDVMSDATRVRFEFVTSGVELTLTFAFGLLLLALIALLYRRTRMAVGARRSGTLLGLRVVQVIILFLILANPALDIEGEKETRSRFLILVDESASMMERDLTGTPETMKQAALGLGLIANAADAIPDPAVRTLRGMNRLDLVRRLLASRQGKLWKDLSAKRDLRFATFSTTLHPSELSPTNGWDRALTNAAGEATFLGTAVRDTVNLHHGALSEILLFSDGVANGGVGPLEATHVARTAGVRIYPVPVGSPSGNPDTVLLSAAANLVANKGDTVEVIVELSTRGYGGKPATVELRMGDAVLDRKPVTLQADTHQRVALNFRAGRLGTLGLTAVVTPQPDEANRKNNAHPFTVRVVDDKYEVTLVEGYPRWEYRFLKNLVARDTAMKSRIILQSEGPAERPWADDLKELEKMDVIVIGDVQPRLFTAAQLETLEQFVGKRGGGLVLIAGEDYMPSAYRNTPLEKLVPVVLPPAGQPQSFMSRTQEPFYLKLTPEGEAYAAMRLVEDPLANAQAWANMPGLYWCRLAARLKPSAVALAVRADNRGVTEKNPLIVHMRYGKGQVLYMAVDSTWRWRHLWGEAHFDRYWGQMLRNLAPERADTKRQSELVLTRRTLTVGEAVPFSALAFEEDGRALDGDTLAVNVEESGTNAQSVVLRRTAMTGAGEYSGTWTPTRDGSYLFRLDQPGMIPAAAIVRVGPLRTELDETAPDAGLLKQMADLTGGTVFDPGSIDKLPELLPSNSRKVTSRLRHALWDNWTLFCLLACANLLELLLRKRWGLL